MDDEIAPKKGIAEGQPEQSFDEQEIDEDEEVLSLPPFPAIDKVLSLMRARLDIPERVPPLAVEQQEDIVATVPTPPPHDATKNNIDSKDIVVSLPPSTPVVIEIATVVTVKSEEMSQQQTLTRLVPVPEERQDEDENIHTRVDKLVSSSGRKKKHVLASMLARQYIRTAFSDVRETIT